MDFGLGAFLEKFEDHFGRVAVKGLLLLIGMALSLTCGKIIWEVALSPLMDAIIDAGLTKTLVNIFWMGVVFVGGAAASAALYIAFMTWQLDRRLARSEQISKEHVSRMHRIESEVDARLKEVDALLKDSDSN